MPIAENQLETWSHQGAGVGSRDTYAAVKKALENGQYGGNAFEVLLQGSYGNDTNIRTESDVDVVIRLTDIFNSDFRQLTQQEYQLQQSSFNKTLYFLGNFKSDVYKTLAAAFPGSVDQNGDKATKIHASGARRNADVIPAVSYKRYSYFKSVLDEGFDPGISFQNRSGAMIHNYPKQHSHNLTQKHQNTNDRLKPAIRMLKNLRSTLAVQNYIRQSIAPSYFLECLLYNMPNQFFEASRQNTLKNLITWFFHLADKPALTCANRIHPLLQDGSNTSWPIGDADTFMRAVRAAWDR